MDTKVLYLTAVVIAAISGGYYYYSGKGKKLDAASAQSMTYSAQNVNVVKTDQKGNLYVRAKVDELEQNLQLKESNLKNLKAEMFTDNQVSSTFFAKNGHGYEDNTKVILSGDVKATKNTEQGELVFTTPKLIGYPKQRLIETDEPVSVTTPNAEFISQGLYADLNEGQYEFSHIRGKYVPK